MATTPTITAGASPRGITRTLSGFVIESETITDADVAEQVPDQNGAIADEISYDERTDLRLTVRSDGTSGKAPATAGGTLTYNETTYHVDSVEEAGTYNGLRRWNVSAHRYKNWPATKTTTT